MRRNTLLFLSLVLAGLSLPATSLAAASANASTKGQQNSGQNNGNGNSGNQGGNNGNGSSGGAPALPATNADAELTLNEVRAEGSVDLDSVLEAVAQISSGRMLAIVPRRVSGRLIYDVTVLERSGEVRHVLIDAKSGKPVKVRQ